MAVRETPRVLVVDDEPDLRQLLIDALSGQEMEVLAVGSGAEALEVIGRTPPDLLIADIRLGDCSGMDLIRNVRNQLDEELPAVVITGCGDVDTLTEASQTRPVELMTKPLDLDRLQQTIRDELARRAIYRRQAHRQHRLRKIARHINADRKNTKDKLDTTCANLAAAYRALSGQMAAQKIVMAYQTELIGAGNDDDVFRSLFKLFVRQSGPLFGVAMVTDENARLKICGRFGVPYPDGLRYCEHLVEPLIDDVLAEPRVKSHDAWDMADMFDESIRKRLVGVTLLTLPLLPKAGEMIGLVVMYRKGEQPFLEPDLALAEMISSPTAVAIVRNG